jgi:hypothetical protein
MKIAIGDLKHDIEVNRYHFHKTHARYASGNNSRNIALADRRVMCGA